MFIPLELASESMESRFVYFFDWTGVSATSPGETRYHFVVCSISSSALVELQNDIQYVTSLHVTNAKIISQSNGLHL